jgi:tRNA(Ile)-lysidine synthase
MPKASPSLTPPSRDDRLVVGVSGGADSIALLGLLFETCPSPSRQILVAHVNYGLRGAESARDERFVRDLARDLGLTCRVLRVTAAARRAALRSGSLQDWARRERYAFFGRWVRARRAWGAVVAHHRDDQAETVLDRLLRGAGSRGLTGLRTVQSLALDGAGRPLRIWRPLLRFPGEDLRAYLRSRRASWREDSSNRKGPYRRNRIRHEVLPFLSRFDPRAKESLARAGETLAADEEYLSQQAVVWDARLAGKRVRGRHAWNRAFSRAPLSMQRRLVRLAAEGLCPDARGLSLERVDEAVAVLAGALRGPRDLGFGLRAVLRRGVPALERAVRGV